MANKDALQKLYKIADSFYKNGKYGLERISLICNTIKQVFFANKFNHFNTLKEIHNLSDANIRNILKEVYSDLSSIFNEEHLRACKDVYERTGLRPKVHVKIDTGMNRIGVRSENAVEYIKKVQNADYLNFEGIFTHLASAEEPDETQKYH